MARNTDQITLEEWRAALKDTLIIENESDETKKGELYLRAVELFTASGCIASECLTHMIPLPKIHVYPDSLPLGIQEHDIDGKTLHMAFGSLDDETIKRRMLELFEYSPAYLENAQSTKADSTRHQVSAEKRIDQDRSKDRPKTKNFPSHRSKGLYEPDEIPDHNVDVINTKEQIYEWKKEYEEHLKFKEKYPHELSVWELYQRNMFSEKIMKRFSGTIDFTKRGGKEVKNFPLWKDWIRGLRVMNGLSTDAISGLLAYKDSNGFSNIETRFRDGISHDMADKILRRNVFRLPEIEMDGERVVDPTYAEKFCAMAGCGEILYAEPIKRKFFQRIEALSKDYLDGRITIADMPAVNELLPILDGLVKARAPYISIDTLKDALQLDGKDYSACFKKMPYVDERHHKKQPSFALSKDDAFNLAQNTSQYIGQFLKTYCDSIGQSSEEVGRNWDCDPKNIGRRHAAQKIRSGTLEIILSDMNPYRLPVDDQGSVRQDVAGFMRKLNNEGVKQNPAWKKKSWININELSGSSSPASTENPDEPPLQGSAQWIQRVIREKVSKLEMREVSSVTLGETVIQCRRGKAGKIEIDKNDWPKLKEIISSFDAHRK